MSNIHYENIAQIKFDRIVHPGLNKWFREMTITYEDGEVNRVILSATDINSLEIMDCDIYPQEP